LLPLLWGAGPMALMLWLDGMMMMMNTVKGVVLHDEHARFRANDRLTGQPPHPSTISWSRPVILAHRQAALWQAAPNPDYTHSSPPPLSHCAASFCTVNSTAPGQVRTRAFLLLLQRSHHYARWTSFKASRASHCSC
jgi:hypothetical protein